MQATYSQQPQPFPGREPLDERLNPPPRLSSMQQQPRQSGEYFSTTTAPLRDHEDLPSGRPSSDPRRRTTSGTSSTSVMARGRPKPSQAPAARPSSFFGTDAQAAAEAERVGGEWGADSGRGAGGAEGQQEQDGGRRRPDSFFGMEGPRSAGLDSNFPAEVAADSATVNAPNTSSRPEAMHERRSSFYGLDAHVTPQPSSVPPSREYSPGPSNDSHRNLPHQQSSSGSGSGSYSSHEHPNRPRYSQAPYAASRAASLYAYSSADLAPPLPAQLLDQSHLQVGNMASLLSHERTLELYRMNAKKTNDPNIQYEFCTFVMDVVADLDQTTEAAKAAAGKQPGEAPTPLEIESRKKQQALVAESITLLNKLAQRGHVKSQYFLGDCYTQGIGTPKGKRDYDKAFPLFMLSGKHGHAAGSYRAAQCLEHGWGTRKDLSKAVSLYRRAAVLTHTQAMHRLGLAEINGELGLSKRPKDGVQWLTRAAELADQVDPPQPQSLHELAILHEKGIENVVFQDEEYAAELLARAAELQYAPSAYKLGECYEYGKMGCPQDAALSIHYYNIAAQQQHPAACFALTAWYLVGSPGVLPQSDTEAYLWAKKAAELGLAKAMYACGYFTEVGIGTYKDERDALEWFRKAAAHGDKRAQDRLRMSGQPLPPLIEPVKRSSPQPPQPDAPVSSLHLPERPRRLSTTGLLTKKRDPSAGGGGKKGKPRRAGSVDARAAHTFEGPPSVAAPVAVDRKGKGKEKALPAAPNGAPPPMPNMVRQRSYSQPNLVPLDYNLRPVGPPDGGDFGPLAYDHREPSHQQAATFNGRPGPGAGLQPPYGGEYGAPNGLVKPEQVRMPLRQQVNGSPVLGSEELAERKKEREKVLQRRKNAGEDKDCVVM
ncbi:hypothetical protein JCM6882_002820 [Rhodosporidiobolus microsporus]